MASSSSTSPSTNSSYTCDTLPTPQNLRSSHNRYSRTPSPFQPPVETTHVGSFDVLPPDGPVEAADLLAGSPPLDIGVVEVETPAQAPPARKLCVRHKRMADGGTNLQLQKALDALPFDEREAVNKIWSGFSSSSHPTRAVILKGILTMCCFSQLSMLSEQLKDINRVDPFSVLPREVAFKVLGYLDAISLCRAAQVGKHWAKLANDDVLWKNICEQHIGQKCHKCGWGLPLLERRRKVGPLGTLSPPPDDVGFSFTQSTYVRDEDGPPLKRQKSSCSTDTVAADSLSSLSLLGSNPSSRPISKAPSPTPQIRVRSISPSSRLTLTRPWKDVYCERLSIERNWRRGRCTVRTLKGHADGVMCLQFSETLQLTNFPVLITGSYDRTARVWNLDTGQQINIMRGHTLAIRALQFDEAKLITGSMDHTLRVWEWRTGRCIRVLPGHTEGVVCLNFDANILASGSVDKTVRIWNFRTGDCFVLRGHGDWVNAVQLWDSASPFRESSVCSTPLFEGQTFADDAGAPNSIDYGKMLFSASDDGTVRLWDLHSRTCVQEFLGHAAQVQSMKLLLVDPSCENAESNNNQASGASSPGPPGPSFASPRPNLPETPMSLLDTSCSDQTDTETRSYSSRRSSGSRSPANAWSSGPKPVLVTGSLDNTIRVWDVDTGKALQTLFGHIEGVWAVDGDKLRLVSGSHDRTIKVWVREEGRCMATLVGHRGAVTCLALGDDRIVSGSDDGDIRVWSFAEIT